ncbi:MULTISPECIES: hypothetical protein [unclassified Mesorhizobium]|uniref:hypothetical protein n=1 Tax=unclassified Mesorhizobium TaxID=325217 RepID=UPI003014EBC6
MPTLNIGGQRIRVEDSFLSLSPEQQSAAVEEIARSLPQQTGPRPQHPEFDGRLVPGYNPKTGLVDRGAIDEAGAFALSTVNGVPIAGPMLHAGAKAAAAGLVTPFSDQSFGQNYADMGRRSENVREDNPIASTAGAVTGAVAGTLPMIAAAPAAFGVGLPTMGGRVLAGGLSGVGIGGADSAVRSGGDLDQTAWGALAGGAAGAAGPVVAPIIGRGVKTVADKLLNSRLAKATGMDKRALALMSTAAERDGLHTAAVQSRLADLGPEGMILDLGPNLRGQAAALAAMPGEGKEVVRSAIGARDAAANRRILQTLDDTLGTAPIPSRVDAGLRANQKALSPAYREVFQEASPVDSAPIAQFLDREIQTIRGDAQKGLRQVRGMLNRVGADELDSNPVVLFETRQAIDGLLETEANSKVIEALSTARQAIDDQLRVSVPRIKEVDASFAELARQREAVGRGQQVLASGREAPRPAELIDEVQQGALPQGMQIGPSAVPMRLRQGARAEIERIVGTKANDRVALKDLIKGEGDWNRERLATLFDEDRADQIVKLLERESQFADTSGIVTRNSESLARREAIDDLTGKRGADFSTRDAYSAGGVPAIARSAAVKGTDAVLEALQGVRDSKAQADLARAITGKDSAVLDALMKATAGSNIAQSKIDRVARALLLSSAGGVGR